jgi:hypothetical protein
MSNGESKLGQLVMVLVLLLVIESPPQILDYDYEHE